MTGLWLERLTENGGKLGIIENCVKWVPRQLSPDLNDGEIEISFDLAEAFEFNGSLN